jgi:hypothetical protein
VGEPELLTFQFFQPVTCVRNIGSKSLSSYQEPLILISSKAPKTAFDSKVNQVDTFPLNMYTY